MRRRMPDNYLRTLRQRTGADRTTLWTVVAEERTGSRYWPAVLALAAETEAAARND